MPCLGVFVTGTDTGVGKTRVAAALLANWREAGVDAVPMKPVQTGCWRRGKALVAPDLESCLAEAGLNPGIDERQDMAPYCFLPACSPHLAAAEAGETISISTIMAAFRRVCRRHEAVVVEGAGGIAVPLTLRRTMLDLMKALGLPVVLTARSSVGTLNPTLLSLAALRDAGVPVLGVVMNQSEPGRWGKVEEDNRRTIERMGKTPVLACIRHGETLVRMRSLMGPVIKALVRV